MPRGQPIEYKSLLVWHETWARLRSESERTGVPITKLIARLAQQYDIDPEFAPEEIIKPKRKKRTK